jgi:hypothetical protein
MAVSLLVVGLVTGHGLIGKSYQIFGFLPIPYCPFAPIFLVINSNDADPDRPAADLDGRNQELTT